MTTQEQNKRTLSHDLLASVVVFLVALPLCLGIAIASGAPPVAGVITGIIGGIVVGSLAGCPLQVSGPAAGLAVIVYELIQTHGFATLGAITVLAGLIQLGAGALKVGQWFRAMAPAVIYGMLAGIGVLIFAAQFHVMVDDRPRESGIQNLLTIPVAIAKGIQPADGSSHQMAAMLGLSTIVILIAWTKFGPAKLKWIPGALIGVGVATAAAQIGSLQVRYVELPANLLNSIQLVPMESFANLLRFDLLVAAFTLAFVASAETLLSATAVDQMHNGPRTEYNRELRSQGIGNILVGLIGGIPMTGVIVRSATNVAAGARTRAATMFHGAWLLVLVAAVPWILEMVPTASLAAVLVYTGYKLVNPQNVRRLLKYGGAPVLIYAATVIMIVATDLLTGILVGLGFSLAKIIYALSHMDIRVSRQGGRLDIHVAGAATFIRMPKLVDTLESIPRDAEVHLHFEDLDYVDHACLDAISNWERQRTERDSKVVVAWEQLETKRQLGSQRRQPRAAVAELAAR